MYSTIPLGTFCFLFLVVVGRGSELWLACVPLNRSALAKGSTSIFVVFLHTAVHKPNKHMVKGGGTSCKEDVAKQPSFINCLVTNEILHLAVGLGQLEKQQGIGYAGGAWI